MERFDRVSLITSAVILVITLSILGIATSMCGVLESDEPVFIPSPSADITFLLTPDVDQIFELDLSDSTQGLWRVIKKQRRHSELIVTFESVDEPSITRKAICIDPKKPTPEKGTLYSIGEDGILIPYDLLGEDLQRFRWVDN